MALQNENSVRTTDSEVEKVHIKAVSQHRELADKPKSVIECCLHCGSIAIKKKGFTKGGVQRYL